MYAIYSEDYFNSYNPDTSTLVATFDTEKQAREYIQASLLKQPRARKIYKSKSLLCGARQAWVLHYEDVIHNPEIDWQNA